MSGIAELAGQYDGLIVDLWGVVHDGIKPYPGVIECLTALRDAGKKVVFLTNAPRRAAGVARALTAMGIGADLYTGIMSSGEAVYMAMRDRNEHDFARLGNRLYHLGPARDRDIFRELPYFEVATPAEADFILNTGPDDYLGPDDPSVYEPALQAGLDAKIPMICANPDLEVIRDGKRIICAGLLAQWYAARGGDVVQRGKPDAAIYLPTLALLGTTRERTLVVGDSLRTDMAGAKAAGLDACWVLSGIHALKAEEAPQAAAQAGIAPVAILAAFHW
ncbi:MAG: HAD family hydrolase [Acidocella sp. 20-57-95]|nr:MAG: HAD family hydrolase [Acidocella sp. 20-57-95]OYV59414.1 MAG: HAD family hydrolase [Acidocella sp. 21-58-7]